MRGSRSNEPIRFAILVFPSFPLMAFSSVIEPLRACNTLARRTCYEWRIVGATSGPITASCGVTIQPDSFAGQLPRPDRVVVCSGGDADHVRSDSATKWIRNCARNGIEVGAVADGAFFLARAGLLDGYSCTLHWTSQSSFAEAFPQIDMRRDLYVIDRKRFTAAGGVGSLDMMLEIIGADYGGELASGVAEWFLHSPLRSSIDRRLMPLRLRTGVRDEIVLSAIAFMEDSVEDALSIPQVANRLGVSLDRLERAFTAALRISPNSYYRRLRLKRAADLLSHSSMSVRDVALASGFQSMSSFARAFAEMYGQSPRAWRRIAMEPKFA